MSDSHLNDGFFARLAAKLPKFKADAGKIKQKALVSNIERKAHEKVPCSICGQMFDAFNGFAVKKKPYCESCQKQLDEGYTALVTMDNKDYAFTKFPEATPEQAARIAGKRMVASSEMVQKAKAAMKSKPENN